METSAGRLKATGSHTTTAPGKTFPSGLCEEGRRSCSWEASLGPLPGHYVTKGGLGPPSCRQITGPVLCFSGAINAFCDPCPSPSFAGMTVADCARFRLDLGKGGTSAFLSTPKRNSCSPLLSTYCIQTASLLSSSISSSKQPPR